MIDRTKLGPTAVRIAKAAIPSKPRARRLGSPVWDDPRERLAGSFVRRLGSTWGEEPNRDR